MGILDELLGGGQLLKEKKDFVDRYEQGNPSEGYSDQEVLERYGEVSHAVPPDQFAQAAQEALGKLSPEERAALVKMVQERAAERGVTLPREVASDPKDLGQVLTDLHEKPGSAPGDSWRYTVVSAGQGRARGHCGHGGQARHAGFVPNRVAHASGPWGVNPRGRQDVNEIIT